MEAKYLIGFADEEQSERVDFANFIDGDPEIAFYEITSLGPVDDIIDVVINNNLDAIVIDFKLKEYSDDFEENGETYLNHLVQTFEKFPCFILTNNSIDAKKYSYDPFKVISKEIIHYVPDDGEDYQIAIQLRSD